MMQCRYRLIECRVIAPSPRQVPEVPVPRGSVAGAYCAGQRANGDFIKTLAFAARQRTQSPIQGWWNIPQGVLHASNVGMLSVQAEVAPHVVRARSQTLARVGGAITLCAARSTGKFSRVKPRLVGGEP